MSRESSFEILEMLKQIIQFGPEKIMFYVHAHAHAPRTQIEKIGKVLKYSGIFRLRQTMPPKQRNRICSRNSKGDIEEN